MRGLAVAEKEFQDPKFWSPRAAQGLAAEMTALDWSTQARKGKAFTQSGLCD